MLNVVCVRTGNKYSPDYVYKLKNMVSRNLRQKHNFYCLTENPSQLPGIDTIPAPIQIADSWCKIGLFSPSLQKVQMGDKMLFLDLDVIVNASLDSMLKGKLKTQPVYDSEDYKPSSEFWISKDWRDPFNSSVMYWVHGQHFDIFTRFKPSDMERLRGDQNLIAEIKPHALTFNEADILSYKFDRVTRKPEKAKIILFHGKPKMTDLPHVEWVQKAWG